MNIRQRLLEVCALVGLMLVSAAQAQTVVKYVHTDALGSVVAMTDANRNVIERREYEPYGAQLTPAVQDGPGYTGHVQDAATGLVYMQQRYYDPGIGGFLSVDPVSVDTTTARNFCRYCYANNNPYKFTDPDGRESAQIHLDRDVRDFGSGKISKQEYFDNIGARAAGAGIGAAVVGGAIVAAPLVADAGMAILANPGVVATATEIAAGAAGVTGTAGVASTLKPGPFAAGSIAARSSSQTFTTAERAAVNKVGNSAGCHTCGTTNPATKSGNFVPDHQPVSSLNKTNASQRLYPQCLNCSRQQGLEAAREIRKER